MERGDVWVYEYQTKDMLLGLRVKEVLHRETTPFQELLVVDSWEFGRVMFLDGCVMVTEKDEFLYHEMLAHVPLMAHPDPKDVLIVGGGDGGTLREVMKHGGVRSCTLCDIDERVTEASRAFFPTLAVALDDPRVTLVHADATHYVREKKAAYDVVLIDSTDPVGPGEGLYTEAFYRSVREALRPSGIAVAQAESPTVLGDVVRRVVNGLRAVFPRTTLYLGPMPTYPGALWSFAAGYAEGDLRPRRRAGLETRYYTPAIHEASLILPPFVEALLA